MHPSQYKDIRTSCRLTSVHNGVEPLKITHGTGRDGENHFSNPNVVEWNDTNSPTCGTRGDEGPCDLQVP